MSNNSTTVTKMCRLNLHRRPHGGLGLEEESMRWVGGHILNDGVEMKPMIFLAKWAGGRS